LHGCDNTFNGEDDQIINELTTPCLTDIYGQIGGLSKFNEYLQKFEPDFSLADLKLSEDSNFRNTELTKYHDAIAITKPPLSSNLIEIKFNPDPNLESSILKTPDVATMLSSARLPCQQTGLQHAPAGDVVIIIPLFLFLNPFVHVKFLLFQLDSH